MSTSLRFIVVVMMLVTAAALGLISYQVVRPATVSVDAPAPAPLQVGYLVAAHALPAGTLAVDADFAVTTAPSGDVPQGAIADTLASRDGLRGSLVRSYLDAGAMVTVDAVLRPRDRGFLANVLEPRTRAVSVGVDPVSGVAGLIWPGDHVDVILTQLIDAAPVPERVLSETILTNLRVIGIDQDIAQGAPSGNAVAGKLARTVTLQVTVAQAEKLAVAQQLGKLLLTICAAKDLSPTDTSGRPTTFGSDVSAALARPVNDIPGITMQLIEGQKRTELQFK